MSLETLSFLSTRANFALADDCLGWHQKECTMSSFIQLKLEFAVCCVAIVNEISKIGMSKLTSSVNNWKIGWRLFFFLPVNYSFESQNKLTNYVTKTSQTFNVPLLGLSSISCWLPIADSFTVGSSHQSMKSLFRKLEKSDAEIEITSIHTKSEQWREWMKIKSMAEMDVS